ncbi:CYTH-like domain-containing protein [Ampelomyces quisqualis]|uniref:mRNA-capping enzyme subunit beta n=1 Tax=Ampelomyces quisqualis TaxID=50730 RepID=A0A6A5QH97_AMPQU|nr:CYTH-like domain-containing protein [Ampelomyces quisqualis]
MDISALVNHDGDAAVLPRRSSSISHSISAPSPGTSSATLPMPAKPTRRQMPLKRKRHDPKPMWAYREGEELPPDLRKQHEQRQPSRPPPPAAHAQPTTPHAPPPPVPVAHRNGPPTYGNGGPFQSVKSNELAGYERPVSNDPHVYDEVSRKVCDFLWNLAINNQVLRKAIAESEHTQLEVEARWGHIIDRQSNARLRGYHDTETVIKSQNMDLKFESTMTMEQHKRMNMYLNGQVRESKAPGASRVPVDYHHTKEVDIFYELGQEQFASLPDTAKRLINAGGARQRIRVTRDQKTNQVLRSMIKHRIGNLEISSPQTEWDYRIGINLEINYPGSIDNLEPVVEAGKTLESMKRQKDRMSYSWQGAYQVDLTQVQQGSTKNHELELELNSDVLLGNADKVTRKEANSFEALINGIMHNLRVLSREMTPAASGL